MSIRISSFTAIPGKLNNILPRKQKIFLIILLVMTIFLSVVETIGISTIMPFITVASNPSVLDEGNYKIIYDFLRFTQKTKFIIVFGISIIIFYLFRAAYNIIYNYTLNKYSIGTQKIFSLKLFKVFLNVPYKHFVQKNTGEIIHIIYTETIRASNLVLNLLGILSEAFTILALYGFMVAVNWKMTLVLTFILLVVIYFIIVILLKKTKQQGIKTTKANLKQSRILHEAFGNLKLIKLRGNENDFLNRFNISAQASARASIISTTLGHLPRNILENIGFSILIGVVVIIIWKTGAPEIIIPTIAMYALALYRMLPGINRMLNNLNSVAFNQNSLDVVYNAANYETEAEGEMQIPFEKSIKLDSLSFGYVTGGEVLQDISLEIKKGESIAITGESGGGKSTLVDLLIGINKPVSGAIYVDDIKITNDNIRSWRNKIGYIPQNIYLFDGTIAENVTFSSEFNEEQLIRTLKMANIWSYLEKKEGINTLVGDGGIQLSGGQKQRVGIARALYTDPEILVLDEATSSLDNDTENKIMDEIYSLCQNKTLIVIAHRLTTVERCKRHIVIENGRIVNF
jgi:ATP-binding cassette subfamily B protein/ATP-binding cassette subfamily C protein